MHCGANYPDEPPTLQFVSQVNLPCVNPRNGMVDPKGLPCLANWQRNNTMETALIELRRYAHCPLPEALLTGPSPNNNCSVTNLRCPDTWPPPPTKRSLSPPRAPSTRTPKTPTK